MPRAAAAGAGGDAGGGCPEGGRTSRGLLQLGHEETRAGRRERRWRLAGGGGGGPGRRARAEEREGCPVGACEAEAAAAAVGERIGEGDGT